jgi:hypothetical protein
VTQAHQVGDSLLPHSTGTQTFSSNAKILCGNQAQNTRKVLEQNRYHNFNIPKLAKTHIQQF